MADINQHYLGFLRPGPRVRLELSHTGIPMSMHEISPGEKKSGPYAHSAGRQSSKGGVLALRPAEQG